MRNAHPREIETYRTKNGREPFTEWFNAIRDTRAQTRIRGRLDRLEKGNFGDCASVGGGVFELRFHFGPGYRIYFGEMDRTIVLCSVVGISQRRHGTSDGQKPIG